MDNIKFNGTGEAADLFISSDDLNTHTVSIPLGGGRFFQFGYSM